MRKILVIDDDELHLALMRRILQANGYEVHCTADGPQGVEIYREHLPDLVLLDIGLPSENGLGVLRKIKEFSPRARVIVITGYPSKESAEVAASYGALEYLQKPVPIDKLLECIRSTVVRVLEPGG